MPLPRLPLNPGFVARRVALLALSVAAGLAAVIAGAALLGGARPALAAPAALDYPGCGASLQACIDDAEVGDTIVIGAGTYVTSFTLNKAVSLTAAPGAQVVLHALENTRVLTVSGSSITYTTIISGLTFTGGSLAGVSCPASCGGGILFTALARPLLVNVVISGNSAFRGGGLYVHTGILARLSGVQVLSNSAASHGGGVHAVAEIAATSTLVQGNQCTQDACLGGGLYATTLNLTDAVLLSNTARLHGGGAYGGNSAALTGGLFQGNTCLQITCTGGGLYAFRVLNTAGASFVGNMSRWHGGGAATSHAGSAVTLNGGLFHGNACLEAGCQGGGLRASNALTLTGSTFTGNSAQDHGGGAYVQAAAVLTGGLFQANACLLSDCWGGGLMAAGALTLTGTHFISNTSTDYGAGAYAGGPASLAGALLHGNRCSGNFCEGGGMFAASILALSDTQFISNTARYNAGGLFAAGPLAIYGGLFQINRCTNEACRGAGLFADDTLALTATRFISNASSWSAAGAYARSHAALNGGLFQGNVCAIASCSGGGLFVANTLTLSGTQFISNTASERAGALTVGGAASLSGALFQGNACTRAGCQGGALRAGNALTLTGGQFIRNSANGAGGAAYHAGSGSASIINNLFAANSGITGTALYLSSAGVTQVAHNTVASPTVVSNAALWLDGANIFITNTLFHNHNVPFAQSTGNAHEDYNMYSPDVLASVSGGVGSGGHSFAGEAAFVDLAGGDYHLTPASDAVDEGTDVGEALDFDGQPRPNGAGFDIGFDELWHADLSISKTDGRDTAAPGDVLTYTIVVSNAGPDIANGVLVSDSLPAGLVNAAWTCLGSGGSFCAASGAGVAIGTPVTVTVGGFVQFTVQAAIAPDASGVIANTAAVLPGGLYDSTPSDHSATDVTSVGRRLYLPLIMR